MRIKYIDLEQILKKSRFYQTLLLNNIKFGYIKLQNKIILYEYNTNNTIKNTYFVNFKDLNNFKYKLIILKNNVLYSEEEPYNVFEKPNIKKLTK